MNLQDTQGEKLPDTPGVYFFLGKKSPKGSIRGREVLYIGKAGSLKNRVRSYFSSQLLGARSPAIVQMVKLAHDIGIKKTDSVLEALILEAQLIKEYQPKYNVKEKDDKSFNYIMITKEDFPQVLIVRQRDLLKQKRGKDARSLYGPFPQGGVLKDALSLVRTIFPFRDKRCIPQGELSLGASSKPCFSYQIGLCPGVCIGKVSKKEYRETIKNIELFFSGKKKTLLRKLEKEMVEMAKKKEFERAGELKKKIFSLKHIQDVALLRSEYREGYNGKKTFRIEGYDVAHTGGANSVGVMSVIENGKAEKAEYRKFILREASSGDDVGALAEILTRRLLHREWRLPELIVVDGALPQKRRAEKIVREAGLSIPVLCVVKDEHHRPRELKGEAGLITKYEREILLVNHEAHRFALSFHKNLRGRKFIEK